MRSPGRRVCLSWRLQALGVLGSAGVDVTIPAWLPLSTRDAGALPAGPSLALLRYLASRSEWSSVTWSGERFADAEGREGLTCKQVRCTGLTPGARPGGLPVPQATLLLPPARDLPDTPWTWLNENLRYEKMITPHFPYRKSKAEFSGGSS